MTTLIDKIRLARAGTAVERCHVQPHALRYSVGHHSLDLITLIILTWQAAHEGLFPRSQLLVAAAFHDVPEAITGDIPSPVKDMLVDTLFGLERRVLVGLGVDVGLDSEEKEWLAACDRLELSLWAMEEVRVRGNRAFESWIVPSDIASWPPILRDIFNVFFRFIKDGMATMVWAELKEAAGL